MTTPAATGIWAGPPSVEGVPVAGVVATGILALLSIGIAIAPAMPAIPSTPTMRTALLRLRRFFCSIIRRRCSAGGTEAAGSSSSSTIPKGPATGPGCTGSPREREKSGRDRGAAGAEAARGAGKSEPEWGREGGAGVIGSTSSISTSSSFFRVVGKSGGRPRSGSWSSGPFAQEAFVADLQCFQRRIPDRRQTGA